MEVNKLICPTFDLLPNELKITTFSFLDKESVTKCGRVNIEWNLLSSCDFIWKNFQTSLVKSEKETFKQIVVCEEIKKYNSRQIIKETCKFLDKVSLNQNGSFTCVIKKDKNSSDNEFSLFLKIITNQINLLSYSPYDIDEKMEILGGFSAPFSEQSSPDVSLVENVQSNQFKTDINHFNVNSSYNAQLNHNSITRKIDISSDEIDIYISKQLTIVHTKENSKITSQLFKHIDYHSTNKINELAVSSKRLYNIEID